MLAYLAKVYLPILNYLLNIIVRLGRAKYSRQVILRGRIHLTFHCNRFHQTSELKLASVKLC